MPRYISYIDDTTRENMSPTHHNTLVGDVDHTPKPPLDNRQSATDSTGGGQPLAPPVKFHEARCSAGAHQRGELAV
jgi:hypothetical protein